MSDVLLVTGAGLLIASAYLGAGLAAALAVAGVILLIAATAWERSSRPPQAPRGEA